MRIPWSRLVAVVILIACAGDKATEPPPPPPVPTSVQLSAMSVTVRMGESSQLTATVLDQHGAAMSGQTFAWSSSDTTKITITTNGLARGVRPGTATLTASSGGLTKSASGTVPAPQLAVEDGASVTKPIGVAGGTVSAKAASGTQFTLTVPPTALSGTVDVTLTPITTIQNLPTGTTLVTAVRLRPDGLAFLSPATLAMDLPASASTANLVGLRFGDDGSALHLVPVRLVGASLTIPISHFSGAGAANSSNPPLIPLDGSGTAAGDALSQLMLQEINAQASGTYDLSAITAILLTWYTSGVKPRLLNGATDEPALNGAIVAWSQWRNTIVSFQPSIAGALDAATSTQQSEARALAATALQAAIQRNNAACLAQLALTAARKVLHWQGVAEYHALATSANALDRSSVLNGLCVRVGYGQVTLPDTVVPMQSALLKVQAGIRFGPGAPLFFASPSVDVAVTATGSIDGSTHHYQTDATGLARATLLPTGAASLQVGLHSCINDAAGGLVANAGLTLFDVCRDTTVSRNVDPVIVYQTDFSGTVGTEWSSQNVTQSPNGQRFLGEFQNRTVTLTLNQLPPHSKVTLEFDFYAIDTWDGNHPTDGPDVFTVSVQNGPVLKTTTFSTVTQPGYEQAFPGNYPGSSFAPGSGGSANVLGYPPNNNNSAGFLGDAVYSLPFTFDHTGGAVVVEFRVSANTTSLTDERWGIDNIRVTVR